MRLIRFLKNYQLPIEKSRTQDQNRVSKQPFIKRVYSMPLSHPVQIKSKSHNDHFNSIAHFLDNVGGVQKKYDSFEQAEKAIKELVGELEKYMVQETLSQYDVDVPIIEYEGKVFHQVIRSQQSYLTAAGKISLERSLYRADGHCICPLELQAGIVEDFWTPSAARLGCYVSAHLSPYQGEKLFKEFGYLQPSKSALTRLSTQLGEMWDTNQSQLEQALCHEITIPENTVTVSASLDGIMIPLNKKIENGYHAPELPEDPTDEEHKDYHEKKAKAFLITHKAPPISEALTLLKANWVGNL